MQSILKLIFLLITISNFQVIVNAQLRVLTGTNILLDANTSLKVDILQSDFIIDSGAFVINDGRILLGDSTNLVEFNKYPITGGGTEEANRNLSNINAGYNIAGLGIISNINNLPYSFLFKRGHKSLYSSGPNQSINRWYSLSSASSITYPLDFMFNFDSTELNNNQFNNLKTIHTNDTLSTWNAIGGISSPYSVNSILDTIGFFTFIETDLHFDQINDTSFCLGDTLNLNFSKIGVFNSDNLFILEISDSNGIFNPIVYLDTVNDDTIDLNSILNNFPTSSNYLIRIRSTSPNITSIDTAISIYEYPLIPTITLSNDTLYSSSNQNNQWYLDGNLLAGENNFFIVPSSNGDYEVAVNNSKCESISTPFSFTTLGLTNQMSSKFSVFPNPITNGIFQVTSFGDIIEKLEIYNCNGQLVLLLPNSKLEQTTTVNMISLESGSYYLKIISRQTVQTKQLIKIN